MKNRHSSWLSLGSPEMCKSESETIQRRISISSGLVCLCLVLLVLFTGVVEGNAQVQNGSISGLVTDATGSRVPDAAVTLVQQATNLQLHGQTNDEGLYAFPQLLPGPYMISVEKEGFRKTITKLTLTVGQAVRIDVTLPVGSETQAITIEAGDATSLDLQTSNLDYTVQSQQVGTLPMNGRNLYGLAALAPGIMPGNNFGVGVAVQRGAVVAAATNNFESNGGVGGNNEILLDGVSIIVCCQGQPAVTPSAEVVGQFKVVASNAPAQYGRSSGGVLSLVTNSGTNQLHGDIYDFLRNDKLDAANYFTKRSGVYPYPGHADYRNPHRANQYGAFVGGPVYLPHFYNGKDKTFFTFGYEAIRNLQPTSGTDTVPTALMRQGIFTEAPLAIYDPNSSNAGGASRTPIAAATCNGTAYAAGYCIPQSSWNAVAQTMLTFFPAPNLPGTTNNLAYAQNNTTADDQFNFRIDHNFSENQRIFMRGTKSKNEYKANDEFNSATGRYMDRVAIDACRVQLWLCAPSQFPTGQQLLPVRRGQIRLLEQLHGRTAGDRFALLQHFGRIRADLPGEL